MRTIKNTLKILISLILIAGQVSWAQSSSDDRLTQLLEKRLDLNAAGKDLDKKESEEFDELAEKKGFIGVAELQAQIRNKKTLATAQTTLSNQQKAAPIMLSGNKTLEKPAATSCKPGDSACLKLIEARDQKANSTKVETLSSVGKTDLFEQKEMGVASLKPVKEKEESKSEVKPKNNHELAEAVDPHYLKRMRKEVSDISEMRKVVNEIKQNNPTEVLPVEKKASAAIYDPVPSNPGVKQNGFFVERDSQTIITKRIGPKDAITVRMCIAYGVSITLDESIDTELQRVILDDKIFFDAQEFENKRGVYVRLLKPISAGDRWDSAIRLVRKSDDKTYVVNLQAVPCPEGQIDFPKVVYLKDKFDVLSAKTSEVMTPEDMIIQVSQGLPRKNTHQVNVYDMVASPGSDWVVFGVEIQPDVPFQSTDKVEFATLDNLQINRISVKSEFLKLQSVKASELRGKNVYRFKVMMAIDKNYILKNRYIHLVYLNKETNHYQYIQVDTLQYFQSLKERGFDL